MKFFNCVTRCCFFFKSGHSRNLFETKNLIFFSFTGCCKIHTRFLKIRPVSIELIIKNSQKKVQSKNE